MSVIFFDLCRLRADHRGREKERLVKGLQRLSFISCGIFETGLGVHCIVWFLYEEDFFLISREARARERFQVSDTRI